jgi:chromosome segregation ATPase
MSDTETEQPSLRAIDAVRDSLNRQIDEKRAELRAIEDRIPAALAEEAAALARAEELSLREKDTIERVNALRIEEGTLMASIAETKSRIAALG